MSENSIRQYLSEIGQIPLLEGRADEKRLAQTIEQGFLAEELLADEALVVLGGLHAIPHDTLLQAGETRSALFAINAQVAEAEEAVLAKDEARERFITANLRLVVPIAKKHQNRGLELMDMIQEGNLSLENAVDGFDWREDNKFSTYATPTIRNAILRAIQGQDRTIRYPGHVQAALARLYGFQRLYPEANPAELAAHMHLGEERVKELIALKDRPRSFDKVISPDDDPSTTLGDTVASPEAAASLQLTEQQHAVHALFEVVTDGFSERDRTILRFRFGLVDGQERLQDEVAEVFGVKRQWVGHLERRFYGRASQLSDSMDDEDKQALLAS